MLGLGFKKQWLYSSVFSFCMVSLVAVGKQPTEQFKGKNIYFSMRFQRVNPYDLVPLILTKYNGSKNMW